MKNVSVNYSEIQIREEDMHLNKTLKTVENKIHNLGLSYKVWKAKTENYSEIRFINTLSDIEVRIIRNLLK